MQIGQIAGPVQVPGGFDLYLLQDKRQVLTADPRDALLSLKQVSIDFAPGTTARAEPAEGATTSAPPPRNSRVAARSPISRRKLGAHGGRQ